MKTKLVKKMVTVTIFLVGAATGFGGYVLGQQKQAPEVRRVVTKLDESGKAVVMIDERTRLTAPRPPNAAANVWITDKSLPDFSWTDDRGKTKIGLMPPKSGTVFRVVDFAPESASGHPTDPNYMMKIVPCSTCTETCNSLVDQQWRSAFRQFQWL